MPLYKVKQVVLLWQNSSDTSRESITMPNMFIFSLLKQIVILYSKMTIFFWSYYQLSSYNLTRKLIIYEIIYHSHKFPFLMMAFLVIFGYFTETSRMMKDRSSSPSL